MCRLSGSSHGLFFCGPRPLAGTLLFPGCAVSSALVGSNSPLEKHDSEEEGAESLPRRSWTVVAVKRDGAMVDLGRRVARCIESA